MYIAILHMTSSKTIVERFDTYPTYSDILLRGYDPDHIDTYQVLDATGESVLPF